MKIFALTSLGRRLARSTRNPDTSAWRIVHYLSNIGHGTPDQIAEYVGLSNSEVSGTLSALRRKNIVTEMTATKSLGSEKWDS